MFKQFIRISSNGALPFGVFLFFAYMLAKAPLLLLGQRDLDGVTLFGMSVILLVLMLSAVVWLVIYRKVHASFFLITFNLLFFLNLSLGEFNSFGFFKYVSLSLFISLTALVFCLLPRRHSLAESLLVFAGLLAVYGAGAVFWGVIKGVQFSLREATIGINGPIVFGQLMIIASAIFFLYGNRRLVLGGGSALLSLVSYSKGPLLAGLFVLFLKRKIFFVLLLALAIGVAFILPSQFFDNRFFYFIESVYQSVTSSDADVLLSGSNYGSVGSRLEQYVLAVGLLSDYPFGIGVGQWGLYSEHQYPHNYIVEVLVEQGLLLGGASLLMMLLFATQAVDRNLRYLVVMFFLFSMFSGSVIDNRGIYFVVLLGLLYRSDDK
ncbi:hypothetical protein DMX05_12705 [Pseudomonas soli]|uniref:O-antigen ligase n=1 Tax=Pseudomonas soli TaxID=1306993 RepID=A0AAJ5SS30_9PSED|nr:hypothetical protein [Pseudomonas soli]PYC43150.1 hypothetical protein DMX05_12705 [Pseudomonas soli]UXZ44317.1 hypothetical protein K7K07_19910 [Pseudomonas soli]